MQENLPLFAAEELPLKQHLQRRLKELAASRLYIGTSSWKYEGWLNSVYESSRYSVQGRYSKARFERDCLREYAEVFQTVSGDFAFYQFPTASFWQGLFSQVPAAFRFSFKVPEEITTPVFPKHVRYGARSGQVNPLFLDAAAFIRQFVQPLEPYASAVGVLMFEFPAALTKIFDDVGRLTDNLSRFFNLLPKTFSYAAEIRSERLLCPEYFRVLRKSGIAHVFNAWTDMPSIREQMSDPDAFTSAFTVIRALTKPGRSYEQAVSLFSPYTHVQAPDAEVRRSVRELLARSKQRAEPAYVYVGNRLEGFAPGTVAAIIGKSPNLRNDVR